MAEEKKEEMKIFIKNVFSDQDLIGEVYHQPHDVEMFEPIPEFVPGQCPLLSEIFKSLLLGNTVNAIKPGFYENDQVFDDAMVDDFEALDMSVQLRNSNVQIGVTKEGVDTPPPTEEKPIETPKE